MATTYSGGIFTPKVQGSLSQRLSTYASDRNALDDELNRSSQVYNVKKALRDMQGANEANAWANKLRQVGGIANQFKSDGTPIGNPFDRQVSNLQSTIQDRINNPTPINVYDTDAYKAALANQQRQARYATRQAQESLGAAGLGRSTNLTDRAQRIQNEANEYLQTQIVPTIYNQEYAKQQQQIAALQGMLNNLRADQGLYDTRKQNEFSNQLATNANQRAASESAMNLRIGLGGFTGVDPRTGKPTYDAQQNSIANNLTSVRALRGSSGGSRSSGGGSSSSSYTATNRTQNDYYDGFIAETSNADGEQVYNNLAQNKGQYIQAMGADNYSKAINNAREQYYQTILDRWRGNYGDLRAELRKGAGGDSSYYKKVLGMELFNKLMQLED